MVATALPEARRFRWTGALTTEQCAAFDADGFLVLDDFLAPATCRELRERALELVRTTTPEEIVVFSTRSEAHVRERYFLESGDRIRLFFEEDAVLPDGRLNRPGELAVNKIGHALHDLDPAFRTVSFDRRIGAIARELGLAQPLALQSMYIFKQPEVGGEVAWHQDATYLRTEPPSVLGFWFALEDATAENGAMEALAGAHRGPLRRRFARRDGRLVTEILSELPLPEVNTVTLTARQGTLVLLHGLLPHRSAANRSSRSRHAYALHLIDGAARYPSDNWLRRGAAMPPGGYQ